MTAVLGSPKLVWKEEYSVGVKEIDQQHQNLFQIINELIEVINNVPKPDAVSAVINKVVEYKHLHFLTEEKYFHQFNFEGTAEHEQAHKNFDLAIGQLQQQYKDDIIPFAFALVDFLEDWLITHLMGMDQKYKQCFHDHGLA